MSSARPPATEDLLLEIGTEELPPKALRGLGEALAQSLLDGLVEAGLADRDSAVQPFAAPRRLGARIAAVRARQPSRVLERRGPALSAAFDATGAPTPAAIGFARSCGVQVSDLQHKTTDKGTWLVFVARERGRTAVALLPEIIQKAVRSLPIPKRMRWSDLPEEFVRPVHWAVLLLGRRTIAMSLLSVTTGRHTQGHRFLAPARTSIPAPGDYEDLLRERSVIASFDERAGMIERASRAIAATRGLEVVITPEQLEEVTGLVEWPEPFIGNFESAFLNLPPEVLTSVMQRHQRYFPVTDRSGRLVAHFIGVANLRGNDPESIRKGNERVLAARFADARFFWEADRGRPLADRVEGLRVVAFQDRLGSLYDKTLRVRALISAMARRAHLQPGPFDRAALLAKADLVTGMVGEFPELQGVMGRYYARASDEEPEVSVAIESHYAPRSAQDLTPPDRLGAWLAVADRLDTLAGMFGIGLVPTGDKDPFGLRRQALAILRIFLEQRGLFAGAGMEVRELIGLAVSGYPRGLLAEDTDAKVYAFLLERTRHYLTARWAADEVESVLSLEPGTLDDLEIRVQAVQAFRRLPQAPGVIAANKRIRNILKQTEAAPGPVDPTRFTDDTERGLATVCEAAEHDLGPLLAREDYQGALARLAELEKPLAMFFDSVMVMAEDPAVRENRLRLLANLRRIFSTVADLSQLKE